MIASSGFNLPNKFSLGFSSPGVWKWECNEQKQRCEKVEATSPNDVIELEACKLTCGRYSTLFPRPSGYAKFGKATVPFMPSNMKLKVIFRDFQHFLR